jgi:hypothetical protein
MTNILHNYSPVAADIQETPDKSVLPQEERGATTAQEPGFLCGDISRPFSMEKAIPNKTMPPAILK